MKIEKENVASEIDTDASVSILNKKDMWFVCQFNTNIAKSKELFRGANRPTCENSM